MPAKSVLANDGNTKVALAERWNLILNSDASQQQIPKVSHDSEPSLIFRPAATIVLQSEQTPENLCMVS